MPTFYITGFFATLVRSAIRKAVPAPGIFMFQLYACCAIFYTVLSPNPLFAFLPALKVPSQLDSLTKAYENFWSRQHFFPLLVVLGWGEEIFEISVLWALPACCHGHDRRPHASL